MIFIHGYLDLYGLDPYAFRLFSHIARRGTCVDSIEKIAAFCRISVRKAQSTLKYLYQQKLIYKEQQKSQATWYRIAPVSDWEAPCNNWENQRYATRLKTYKIKYEAEPEKYEEILARYEAKLGKYTTQLNTEMAKVRASMFSSNVLRESIKDSEKDYEQS